MMEGLASVRELMEELRQGRPVILVDDEDRENEGDLIMAAEHVTPEWVNFMLRECRGLLCVALTEERARALDLPLMVEKNQDPQGTRFTVSVDARGTTTGISAFERAATIRLLADPEATAQDFRRPGHIFPLVARPGGVLRRAGHTEATVDLLRLAGLRPVGSLIEILKEDGTMARLPDLLEFAGRHGLKVGTIADLIRYRLEKGDLYVKREAEALLPTRFGEFRILGYRDTLTGEEHAALVMGSWDPEEPVLVRMHSECLTGDALHSLRCDCGFQRDLALERISKEGKGVLVYLRQEGRGIGLVNKIRAYHLQDQGLDTVEANLALGFPPDLRDYGVGAQILYDLGVRKMRLLTNNPRKVKALSGFGIEIVERIPLRAGDNPHNERYLQAKKEKLGHWMD
jgi:3,4-dihydroxy 2-butanone 4-phosphate synthase/GTP cyclohydrolase II